MKNILIMIFGTGFSQVLTLAVAPILTRLYSPEQFGVFALFFALYSAFSSLATCRYEVAILMPESLRDAKGLMILSVSASFFLALLSLLILIVFQNHLGQLLNMEDHFALFYLLPFMLFAAGLYQALNYLTNRQGLYQSLASRKVIQSICRAVVDILGGVVLLGALGLSLGVFAGLLGGLLYSFWYLKTRNLLKCEEFKLNELKSLALEYKNYPLFDAPYALMQVLAQQLPIILMKTLFSAGPTGFFHLTQRVCLAPVSLISGSVLDVFREKMTSLSRDNPQEAREFFFKNFLFLSLMGLPPTVLLFFYGSDLFALIFGGPWRMSGEFAELLAPAFFFQFVVTPLSFVFYIAKKQHLNLFLILGLMISVVGVFFLVDNVLLLVASLSGLMSIYYLIQLALSCYFVLRQAH